jgi:hypothetical protein
MWLVIPFDHCLIATTWLLCATTANDLEDRLGEFLKDISQPESRWDEKPHSRKIEEVSKSLQQWIAFGIHSPEWFENQDYKIRQARYQCKFVAVVDIPLEDKNDDEPIQIDSEMNGVAVDFDEAGDGVFIMDEMPLTESRNQRQDIGLEQHNDHDSEPVGSRIWGRDEGYVGSLFIPSLF